MFLAVHGLFFHISYALIACLICKYPFVYKVHFRHFLVGAFQSLLSQKQSRAHTRFYFFLLLFLF